VAVRTNMMDVWQSCHTCHPPRFVAEFHPLKNPLKLISEVTKI